MDRYEPPFTITNIILEYVSSIMEKVGRVSSFDNLSKYPILRKQNRIKSIHSSCAIEANSLSLNQVTDVVNGVKVVGPQKDIIEVKNVIRAYAKIETIKPLNEKDLKAVHGIIGENVVQEAEKYRSGNEGIEDEKGNVIFIAPQPIMVPSLMNNLFKWTNDNYKVINPLILSSVFHYEFVFIHPFRDGNGRMARYWQNAILGKWKPLFYWLPIESQIRKYQNDYYGAISQSHINGNSTFFIEFMLKMIDLTLNELIDNALVLDKSFTIYVNKLVGTLKPGIWYTSNEILNLLRLKSKETLRKNYLNDAIKNGLLVLEFPDKPTSRNQRYKLK